MQLFQDKKDKKVFNHNERKSASHESKVCSLLREHACQRNPLVTEDFEVIETTENGSMDE